MSSATTLRRSTALIARYWPPAIRPVRGPRTSSPGRESARFGGLNSTVRLPKSAARFPTIGHAFRLRKSGRGTHAHKSVDESNIVPTTRLPKSEHVHRCRLSSQRLRKSDWLTKAALKGPTMNRSRVAGAEGLTLGPERCESKAGSCQGHSLRS